MWKKGTCSFLTGKICKYLSVIYSDSLIISSGNLSNNELIYIVVHQGCSNVITFPGNLPVLFFLWADTFLKDLKKKEKKKR